MGHATESEVTGAARSAELRQTAPWISIILYVAGIICLIGFPSVLIRAIHERQEYVRALWIEAGAGRIGPIAKALEEYPGPGEVFYFATAGGTIAGLMLIGIGELIRRLERISRQIHSSSAQASQNNLK